MYPAKQITNGNSECYGRNFYVRMLVQFSNPPHSDWGVEWPASWIWQYDTPVQYAGVFSLKGTGTIVWLENRFEWPNTASFWSASSSTPQLCHSSGELREGRWRLPSCMQFALNCCVWKRWVREDRQKHGLQPDLAPCASWSVWGHWDRSRDFLCYSGNARQN